jgi:hypothetical protein
MSEGGEPKQNTQNQLTSPMSEGGNHNGHLCPREENISFDYKMCGF